MRALVWDHRDRGLSARTWMKRKRYWKKSDRCYEYEKRYRDLAMES